MRSMVTLLLLVGTVPLLGSECEQPLFPVINCETDADCVTPCTEECEAIDEELMSADCDANMFCDCLCMLPGEGAGGTAGAGGAGGMGGG